MLGQHVYEPVQRFVRRRIHPVPVLQQEHQRPLGSPGDKQCNERLLNRTTVLLALVSVEEAISVRRNRQQPKIEG